MNHNLQFGIVIITILFTTTCCQKSFLVAQQPTTTPRPRTTTTASPARVAFEDMLNAKSISEYNAPCDVYEERIVSRARRLYTAFNNPNEPDLNIGKNTPFSEADISKTCNYLEKHFVCNWARHICTCAPQSIWIVDKDKPEASRCWVLKGGPCNTYQRRRGDKKLDCVNGTYCDGESARCVCHEPNCTGVVGQERNLLELLEAVSNLTEWKQYNESCNYAQWPTFERRKDGIVELEDILSKKRPIKTDDCLFTKELICKGPSETWLDGEVGTCQCPKYTEWTMDNKTGVWSCWAKSGAACETGKYWVESLKVIPFFRNCIQGEHPVYCRQSYSNTTMGIAYPGDDPYFTCCPNHTYKADIVVYPNMCGHVYEIPPIPGNLFVKAIKIIIMFILVGFGIYFLNTTISKQRDAL